MAQVQECAPRDVPKGNRRGSLRPSRNNVVSRSPPPRRASFSAVETSKEIRESGGLQDVLTRGSSKPPRGNGTSVATASKKGGSKISGSRSKAGDIKSKTNSSTTAQVGSENQDPKLQLPSFMSEVTSAMDSQKNGIEKGDGSRHSKKSAKGTPKQGSKPKVSKDDNVVNLKIKQQRRLSSSSAATESTYKTTKSTKKKNGTSKSSRCQGEIEIEQTLASLAKHDGMDRGFVETDELNNSMPSRGSVDSKANESDKAKMAKWPSSGDVSTLVNQERDKLQTPKSRDKKQETAPSGRSGTSNTNAGDGKKKSASTVKTNRRDSMASLASRASRATTDGTSPRKSSSNSTSSDNSGGESSKPTGRKKKSDLSSTIVNSKPLFTLEEDKSVTSKSTFKTTKSAKPRSDASATSAANRFEASFGVSPAFPAPLPTSSNSSSKTSKSKKKKSSSSSPALSSVNAGEKDKETVVQFQDYFPKTKAAEDDGAKNLPGGRGGGGGLLGDEDSELLSPGKASKKNGKTRYKRGKVGPNPTFKLRNIFGGNKKKEGLFYLDESENDEGALLERWD